MFEASIVKLVRARKFIDEIKVSLDGYVSRKPFSARVSFVADGMSMKIDWDGIGLEPGAVVGDCVHNLRTALDLMASELARTNGKSHDGVYFPFANSESELGEMIRRKKFHQCGEDAMNLLHTFSPYKGGNAMLRGLHDLDIQDKHMALIVTHQTFDWQVDAELVIPESGVEVDPDIVISNHVFHFPPDGPLANMPIIQTLEELVHLVEGILEAFESLVVARPANGVSP